MNKLTIVASLLLLCLFTACETDETITEISGKVIDIETKAPVAGARLNLTVSEGVNVDQQFINPSNYSVKSNTQGAYTFILPDNAKQQLFKVVPDKAGYVEVNEKLVLSNSLKQQQRNLHDITVAKGSYLEITVNKTSDATSPKTLLLNISYLLSNNTTPLQGQPIVTEKIELDPKTINTSLVRGFYFKNTNSVQLHWVITTKNDNTTTVTFSQAVPLVEHDTTHVEISY